MDSTQLRWPTTGFTEFYRVLPSFTEFWNDAKPTVAIEIEQKSKLGKKNDCVLIEMDSTQRRWLTTGVLPSFTEFYRVLKRHDQPTRPRWKTPADQSGTSRIVFHRFFFFKYFLPSFPTTKKKATNKTTACVCVCVCVCAIRNNQTPSSGSCVFLSVRVCVCVCVCKRECVGLLINPPRVVDECSMATTVDLAVGVARRVRKTQLSKSNKKKYTRSRATHDDTNNDDDEKKN